MDGSNDALFYAAFELRCCIESRQAEYARALDPYKDVKIRAWNIGDNSKRIRKVSYADRIALMRFELSGKIAESYHTPVTDALVTFAEKELNTLLHAQADFRADKDEWWVRTQNRLLVGYRQAWLACQGDSLVPPLLNGKTNELHPLLLERQARNAPFFEPGEVVPGRRFSVEIRYLATAPDHWKCDL